MADCLSRATLPLSCRLLGVEDVLVVHARCAAGAPAATAHGLLRQVLLELTGTADHTLLRACATCGGPHGKPILDNPSLHVSLSRAEGIAVVAVTAAGPVGVDVERVAATDFAGFDGVALAPGEQAFTPVERARAWTRKEAVLKATGTGLMVDPRSVDVRPDVVLGAHLQDLPLSEGLAGAVAVLARERPMVRVQEQLLSP